tara:strand:- start:18199 stop:18759 length:561 start_codon:yes stop_codon:yes gene_type:complete
MDINPDKLNLDELYREKKMRQDNKLKIYNRILKRVHDKIKYVSRQRNSLCFCSYVVPEFLLGVPKYDSAACIAYIIEKLNDNGLAVKYTHPNLLMISWNHYIPPQQRQIYKKETGITIDGFGNVKQRKKDAKNDTDPNSLLAKGKGVSIKKKDANFKDINSYKPQNSIIYNNDLMKKIESSISKKD